MSIQTVSIIGLGALGILFGHHLSQRMKAEELRIIADRERIARYEDDKIYCNGEACHFHYTAPDEAGSPADLIIFTVKANGLKSAIDAVRNQVGENTIILSALNGITSEAIIGKIYGMDKMLYCVAQGMDAVKEGNRLVYHHPGILCFGEKEPGIISPKAQAVSEFFRKTEFPHEMETDMYRRQWGKFMLNVGVNQTVAVFETDYRGVQAEGHMRDTMIAAMREVIALSKAEGIFLTEADVDYWLKVLATLDPESKPSMRQDMEAKRHSEVDLFAGTVLELGRKHGIATPVNQYLYDRVMEMEKQF